MLRKRFSYALAVALTWIAPTAVAATAVGLRLGESPPNAPSALGSMLATKYAPILRLDSDEQLEPVDRVLYVDATQLWALYERRHGRDTRERLAAHMTYGQLPARPLNCPTAQPPFDGCNYYLRVAGAAVRGGLGVFRKLQETILKKQPKPVVYWYYDDKHAALRYWFFYVFNDFLNWHEGDWEQITISFDPSNSVPQRVGYSSHGNGQSKAWRDLSSNVQISGDSPVVYVARGSHANYFRTGLHPVPECKYRCNDRSDGQGRQLTPASYMLEPLKTPAYPGDYGSGNFLKGGLKRLGTGINVADPLNQSREPPLDWLKKTAPADDGSAASAINEG